MWAGSRNRGAAADGRRAESATPVLLHHRCYTQFAWVLALLSHRDTPAKQEFESHASASSLCSISVFSNRAFLAACLLQVGMMHDTQLRFAIEKHPVQIPHRRYSVNRATAAHRQRYQWMNR